MVQPIALQPRQHHHEPAVQTRNLGVVYPGGVRALSNVTLDVKRSDFVVVVGSSGAGKSTLLRCVNRLVTPSEGALKLFGQDVTRVTGAGLRTVRQRVGMIFQQFHLIPRLTVLENVLVGRLRFTGGPVSTTLSIARLFPGPEREAAFERLKQVGLADKAFQRADALSGGQQQRVAIARALAQDPDVFLADEPIASLDPRSSEVVMETLARIHEERNIPVLVNLHHVDFARRYGRRMIGVKAGRIVLDGVGADLTDATVRDLYSHKLSEAYGEAVCA